MCRTVRRFALVLVVTLVFGQYWPVMGQQSVDPDYEFYTRFLKAWVAQDRTGMDQLVANNTANIERIVARLLGLSVNTELNGDRKSASDTLGLTMAVARVYQTKTGEAFLVEKVSRYAAWSAREKAQWRESEALIRKAQIARDRNDIPGVREALTKASVLLQELGDESGVASVLTNLGLFLSANSSREEGLTYYRRALKIERRIGNRQAEAKILSFMGDRGSQVTPASPPVRAQAGSGSPTPRPTPFGAPVRFRADLWSLPAEPLLGFVEIPGGEFTMGSDKSRDPSADIDELQHKVTLPRYYLGRYEVTVAQYKACVAGKGCQGSNTDAIAGSNDWPVRNVSWHEAMVYAAWLDGVLRKEQSVPSELRTTLSSTGSSCRVTLPSEAEWEKAARGVDGRIYPWGDAVGTLPRANFGDWTRGGPTSVGSYPDGVSPYGLFDMSGNVSEWTRSVYLSYPYRAADPKRDDIRAPDSTVRVTRGGSFIEYDPNTRTATRSGNYPSNRFANLGFRVVVSCLRI